jgi:hypothetical protein
MGTTLAPALLGRSSVAPSPWRTAPELAGERARLEKDNCSALGITSPRAPGAPRPLEVADRRASEQLLERVPLRAYSRRTASRCAVRPHCCRRRCAPGPLHLDAPTAERRLTRACRTAARTGWRPTLRTDHLIDLITISSASTPSPMPTLSAAAPPSPRVHQLARALPATATATNLETRRYEADSSPKQRPWRTTTCWAPTSRRALAGCAWQTPLWRSEPNHRRKDSAAHAGRPLRTKLTMRELAATFQSKRGSRKGQTCSNRLRSTRVDSRGRRITFGA